MSGHAGLTKKTITAKGKHGSVKRTYWVRASGAVKGAARKAGAFVKKHKGAIKTGAKIAGAVAGAALVAKGLHSASKNRMKIAGAVIGARGSWKTTGAMNKLAGKVGADSMKMGLRDRLRTAKEDGQAVAKLGGHLDSVRNGAAETASAVKAHNSKVRSSLEGMARQYGVSTAPKSLGSRIRSRFSRKSS